MGKKKDKETDDEATIEDIVDETFKVSKNNMTKVKFKNFTKVAWKMYSPWQVAEFDSISWFERLVSIVE